MERRTFLKTVGVTAGASVAGPGVASGSRDLTGGPVHPSDAVEKPGRSLSTASAPDDGVEILTDEFDVSHVYANDLYSLGYGQGYVQARDRLFQLDVMRNVGRGESSKVVGAGQVESDIGVKRDLYTEEELQEQWDNGDPAFKELVQGFVEGVNAKMDEMDENGDMPGEFSMVGRDPDPWKPTDTVAIIAFTIGMFGVEGGNEFENARALAEMFNRFGSEKTAWKAFHDLNKVSVPEEHTGFLEPHEVDSTHERALEYDEVPEAQLAAIRASLDSEAWGLEELDVLDRLEERFRKAAGIFSSDGFGSNAVIVGGEYTETGKPMLGGGPQMSLLKPPILHEIGLHGAGYDVAGAAVVGTPGTVVGRTPDFAWTPTTSRDDVIDTIAIDLHPDDRYQYEWDGEYHDIRTEAYRHEPSKQASIVDGEFDFSEYEQEVAWIEQEGERMPVIAYNEDENIAWVQRTATWMEEFDAAAEWAQLGRANDREEFEGVLADFSFGFNFHYVDDEDIAVYRTGKIPYRVEDGDPRVPMPADEHNWNGYVPGTGIGTGSSLDLSVSDPVTVDTDFELSEDDEESAGRFDAMNHSASGVLGSDDAPDGGHIVVGQVNPSRGYVVNWNNAPAPGWLSGDSMLNWQSVHRADVLERLMQEALDRTGGNLSLADVEAIIEDGAVEHPFAPALVPHFIDAARASGKAQLEAIADELEAWADTDYAFRPGSDGRYPNGGMAIWEEVRHELHERMFGDTMGELAPLLEFDPTESDSMDGEIDVDPHIANHGSNTSRAAPLLDTLEGRTNFEWLGDYSNEVALFNAHSDLAMEATDGTLWGTDVEQNTPNLNADQLWELRNAETGDMGLEDGETYVIHAANRETVAALDDPIDPGSSLELGDPPGLEEDNNLLEDIIESIADFFSGWFGDDEEAPEGSEALFTFHENDDGTHRIENLFSEDVLQPEPGDIDSRGGSIVQAEWDGSQEQRWEIDRLDSDTAAEELLIEAMSAAGERLTARFGSANPGDWRMEHRESEFSPVGGGEDDRIPMTNRASYQQSISIRDGHDIAGSVLPPSNVAHMSTWEVLGTQIGSEPSRLTKQLDLYVDFGYKPHPVVRERVENQATESVVLEP